jgi:UDP-N-acetylglucosamine 4,6-dehydratase
MSAIITGKRIVVTGGTGSFGTSFIRSILPFRPKEIVVLSRDENKQGSMKLEFAQTPLRFVLGDVRDYESVRHVMRGVDIVVHAAALKWIPEVESNVWEGVKTNVIGTQVVIQAALDARVQKVVALSTDKAVEPVNAYGMGKALQERLMATANSDNAITKTIFVSTRYGNVLGSRGSVVPLFRNLIDASKPLTVTDPAMTRFVLTLEQGTELILKALKEGVGGEVFVRNIASHSIQDLVDVMLEHVPREKRNVVYTGPRPGEKTHETLISEAESSRTIEMGEYFVVLPQVMLSAVKKKYAHMKHMQHVRFGSDTTRRLTKQQLRALLKAYKWIP